MIKYNCKKYITNFKRILNLLGLAASLGMTVLNLNFVWLINSLIKAFSMMNDLYGTAQLSLECLKLQVFFKK